MVLRIKVLLLKYVMKFDVEGNVAAAAASWSSPLNFTVSSVNNAAMATSTDPWENYQDPLLSTALNEDDLDESNLCNCSTKRSHRKRTMSRNSPLRGASFPHSQSGIGPGSPRFRVSSSGKLSEIGNSDTPSICRTCGKRHPTLERHRFGTSTMSISPSTTAKQEEDPQHAKHLLEATPQLRFLSPQSTDMDGGDPSAQQSFLHRVLLRPDAQAAAASSSGPGGGSSGNLDLSPNHNHPSIFGRDSGISQRDQENQRAAAELASLLWTLAHEMSLEDFGSVESKVFTAVFGLVHDFSNPSRRIAGLVALHALLSAPSADEERKSIKFANTLSQALRTAGGDFEFLSLISAALGKMAKRSTNVDFVESEITRALEWLRTERSDRRLAACLALREFAIHAPTTFRSKTSQHIVGQGGSNQFLDHIFQAIRDPQPMVRACAADALSQCLKILVDRRQLSLTGLLCQVHFSLMEGLNADTSRKRPWQAIAEAEASQHGSLLVVSTMLVYTGDFMLPRYNEVCESVIAFCSCPKALIRLEVIRLIPRLAQRRPRVFGRHHLEQALAFLIESASTPLSPRVGVDVRPAAFAAIGQLALAMTDDETGSLIGGSNLPTLKISEDEEQPGRKIVSLSQSGITHDKLGEIFSLVRSGLNPNPVPRVGNSASTVGASLHCASNLVEALGDTALPYLEDLIDKMFLAGLSTNLIQCLHSISQCIPAQQSEIEDRMLKEVSLSLAGVKSLHDFSLGLMGGLGAPESLSPADAAGASGHVVTIDMSSDPFTVRALVLSLQTLASFGGRVGQIGSNGIDSLLPFLKDVVAKYLRHPSAEVRRTASLTCCMLLIPHETTAKTVWGGYSGLIIEEILQGLVQVAVSDNSATVRLCVVRALDSRYDSFLAQTHHLDKLFILLQDETLATKAAGLRLLGRLTSINPAPILPVLRHFLEDIVTELECGVDTGRGREEATRLLVVFLRGRSLQRLIHPVLKWLVTAIPLDSSAPPRLASASLVALGELAIATGSALRPSVQTIIPHVLEVMMDQSSASKQRTSLRTLGQIAGSTGYVIRPYLEYPTLLSQATDILPATKRAPWSLRREVIRTLGILGALDPDRYHAVAARTRKGAVGGAYFEEIEYADAGPQTAKTGHLLLNGVSGRHESMKKPSVSDDLPRLDGVAEDDKPAFLYMYEQYAMVAQPVSNLRPPRRMTPADEEFYPTVAVQALMRIFKDASLTVHHGTVAQAIMFIFQSLGLGCVPYLHTVVPHVTQTLRICSTTLRESLLKQLATLSLIVREHLRPYIQDVFDVSEEYWDSSHLGTIFLLISNIAVAVPDEFKKFCPRLVRRLLVALDDSQVADWTASSISDTSLTVIGEQAQKLALVLANLSSLRHVLSDYLHILVPALLKLADSIASITVNGYAGLSGTLSELSILIYRTLTNLLETLTIPVSPLANEFFSKKAPSLGSEHGLPSRVVHPIIRVFKDKPPSDVAVGFTMVETLCTCSKLIGLSHWISIYDEVVREAISSWISGLTAVSVKDHSQKIENPLESIMDMYELTVGQSTGSSVESSNFSVPEQETSAAIDNVASSNNLVQAGDTEVTFEQPVAPLQSLTVSNTRRIDQAALQRSWDVSQRSSMEDWDEWMRRFAIELLRQAPSPALRACASLAQAYQPLARELFSAAFACCWADLNEAYQKNLVSALETAFVANVSPEILQALLNLAEFQEHDPSGGLPIEIGILANLALKCRAYAKALHYKEREYREGASNASVEALISINRKLDLQEAALGILKVSSLGDALVNDVQVGDELSSKFGGRHHAYDMCYSVMFGTEERNQTPVGPADMSAKQELWLAKLGSWADALAVYEDKLERDPRDFEAMLGCMRCLDASGEWRKVLQLADSNWQELGTNPPHNSERHEASPRSQRKALRMCAHAAWRLGNWEELEKYSGELVKRGSATSPDSADAPLSGFDPATTQVDFDGAFYSAISYVHKKEWASAANAIDAARKAMDGRLTALLAESYSRAYSGMVTAQTLSEMEEIIEFRKVEERSKQGAHLHPVNRASHDEARQRLLSVWRDRLAGCRRDAEVHSSILAVRSLILEPGDDVEAILSLSELSRQAHRHKFAERVLLDQLNSLDANIDGPIFGHAESLGIGVDFGTLRGTNGSYAPVIDRILQGQLNDVACRYGPHHENWSKSFVEDAGGGELLIIQYRLYSSYVKHLWFTQRRHDALRRCGRLCEVMDMVSHCENVKDSELLSSCWVELGEWKIAENVSPSSFIPEDLQVEVLTAFKQATMLPGCGYKAWHSWALLNFRIALQSIGSEHASQSNRQGRAASDRMLRNHVVAAVNGFVNAVSLGTVKWSASVQQDLLNLLTCLFKFGNLQDVATFVNNCIGSIAIEAWLGVLPQLLARIHIKQPTVRSVLHPLLVKLGEKHPQAFIYPLSVLLKSPVAERKSAAQSLMNSLRSHSSELVSEALLVSAELIRVAILWLETWHEGLEDASRLYFGDSNTAGMLELLLPLHENLERGAETERENEFLNVFGRDLGQAHFHIREYMRLTGTTAPSGPGSVAAGQTEEAETAINKAWDIYYTVFRRINKQLPSLTKLELSQCSPALSRAKNLELGVPGSYRVDGSYVKIHKFVPKVQVITSKQRPRKITLRGSDGKDYVYLLKGHEDLRQDERVMQLFGLVNALLARDPQTKKHDLTIQRYAIAPLSHNCGLVGWVPHTDTFHSLIRDYRQSKDIPLNMENREMLKIAPDYELMTVMQKVEVFTKALKNTTGKGNDLYEILWLKSTNSEEWLERRTTFTRSLAVMSMVGYILGLGDRHPSNLMLDKVSGRVLHIDFGDCFEVAKNRDKFPEKVPFRLTRMLIKAMEVAGIEGSYRSTCERTMTVLRDSRDSLVAMLEAFVYDPLISWRLADMSGEESNTGSANNGARNRGRNTSGLSNVPGQEIGVNHRHVSGPAILEDLREDEEHVGGESHVGGEAGGLPVGGPRSSRARGNSMDIYQGIQRMAANVVSDDRISSLAGRGNERSESVVEGSLARSRMERSMRQREVMSLLDGENGAAHEGALNEKALKVIRRVQDKLNGTDFPDSSEGELDVPDQVQRLIVQATSSENLCQLFIGWCAFW